MPAPRRGWPNLPSELCAASGSSQRRLPNCGLPWPVSSMSNVGTGASACPLGLFFNHALFAIAPSLYELCSKILHCHGQAELSAEPRAGENFRARIGVNSPLASSSLAYACMHARINTHAHALVPH